MNTIDLTSDEELVQVVQPPVIDLTQDDLEVHDFVTSVMLTYPRVMEQLERAGVEQTAQGLLWWDEATEHLCQVDGVKKFFLNHLLSCDPKPAYVLIALEKHQDGAEHIHAMVQWTEKRSFTSTHFDWRNVHPNILKLNQPQKARMYVRKSDPQPLRWVRALIQDEIEGFFPDSLPPYKE